MQLRSKEKLGMVILSLSLTLVDPLLLLQISLLQIIPQVLLEGVFKPIFPNILWSVKWLILTTDRVNTCQLCGDHVAAPLWSAGLGYHGTAWSCRSGRIR